jgi:hypothetical protein
MQLIFKHSFLYLTIGILSLFTGCIQREYRTIEYTPQPQANIYNFEKPIKVKEFNPKKGKAERLISAFYKKPIKVCRPRYIIKYRTYPNTHQENPFNHQVSKKNSTFEEILKTSREKRVKKTSKIKYNNNQEEFPSNVPIGSKK